MLKGLALTPPVIGRISIGKIVEKNGMRLPEKDDEFTIHSQVQNREGWVKHPIDEQLRKGTNGKLRSIPIQLIFDDPDLNLRANYTLFDRQTGRPLCVGNGETCRRSTAEGLQTLPCPAPEGCELAAGGHCKPFGRLNVRIGEDDELGSFIFHTADVFPCGLGWAIVDLAIGIAASGQVNNPVASGTNLLCGSDR